MNVKRFSARTSRDALNLVRQAFGADAVVLSTRPCAEGVEVLAMAPDAMAHIEQVATDAPRGVAGGGDGEGESAVPPAARDGGGRGGDDGGDDGGGKGDGHPPLKYVSLDH